MYLQIKASDIDLVWKKSFDDMRRRHERRMYPPRIKMTVSLHNPDIRVKLPLSFSGYVGEEDHELDVELTLPIGRFYCYSSCNAKKLLSYASWLYYA